MSWQVWSFVLLGIVLVCGFAWYERSRPSARLVALVAALAALAVAGRLVLAPIPNVVATTDIALITGYALGGAPGFAVGALAAPVSNIWLGQGPWTPWQMAGWGMVGLLGAWLATVSRRRLGRLGLASACAAAGFAYGALLDYSVMAGYGGEQSLDRYLALSARGIPFNVAHAAGNFVFALAAGPALVRMISRYRDRLDFDVAAGRGAAAGDRGARDRGAAGPARRAGRRRGGGAGLRSRPGEARPGLGPALPRALDQPRRRLRVRAGRALEPADDRLGDARARGGRAQSARRAPRRPAARSTSSRANSGRLRSTGDLERTILALEAAGVNPRSFAGRDLVAELRKRRNCERLLAEPGQPDRLRRARAARRREPSARACGARARWLDDQQRGDGGWGFQSGAAERPRHHRRRAAGDARAGRRRSATASATCARSQRGEGGWGLNETGVTNSQSTAWAVQGLVARRRRTRRRSPARGDPDSTTCASASAAAATTRYNASSSQTPVWVTSQALLAVRRKALPMGAVPRASRAGRAAGAGGGAGRRRAAPRGSPGAESGSGGGSGGRTVEARAPEAAPTSRSRAPRRTARRPRRSPPSSPPTRRGGRLRTTAPTRCRSSPAAAPLAASSAPASSGTGAAFPSVELCTVCG